MNILMFTNTFTPHVGGVARSVQQFRREYLQSGHEVLVIAPDFPGAPAEEAGVLRIPAVQQFNGTDFSVPVPVPSFLWSTVEGFQPDVVHTHHPFLLGDTALRVSSAYDIPVVFTHHTQYEHYTHYVPGDSELMKRFVVDLVIGFCNLCDHVIAPSETIRQHLLGLGVMTPIEEIPTGVDTQLFQAGDGQAYRTRQRIAATDFVIGHVGRLAPEKGLTFLIPTVAQFMKSKPNVRFLVAGTGPSRTSIVETFARHGCADRLILLGTLDRPELADVYHAMDVFVFASQSETQGMVLTEAMAASTPVIAIDAPGVREVVRDNVNGILLPDVSTESFAAALERVLLMPVSDRKRLIDGALETAEQFSMQRTAAAAVQLYRRMIWQGRQGVHGDDVWSTARRRLEEEWKIWNNVATAARHAVLGSPK